MESTMIYIFVHNENKTYAALFSPVKKVGKFNLGWAEVYDPHNPGLALRFPTVVHSDGAIYTAYDWQATYLEDLSDPEDMRSLLRTGAGRFYNPASKFQDRNNYITLPKEFSDIGISLYDVESLAGVTVENAVDEHIKRGPHPEGFFSFNVAFADANRRLEGRLAHLPEQQRRSAVFLWAEEFDKYYNLRLRGNL